MIGRMRLQRSILLRRGVVGVRTVRERGEELRRWTMIGLGTGNGIWDRLKEGVKSRVRLKTQFGSPRHYEEDEGRCRMSIGRRPFVAGMPR